MSEDRLFHALDISASGLHAQWVRMQVVANNVANADTTHTPEGGPYRRREVVFSTLMNGLNGVDVTGVVTSDDPPRMVYNPGHPDADARGYVAMPAVQMPTEMVDMVTASRAYQANLAAMRNFRQICEETLKLLQR
jgi:flagellar basal-body rod protein FlgC